MKYDQLKIAFIFLEREGVYVHSLAQKLHLFVKIISL